MPLICLFGIISNLYVGPTREGSIGLAHCTPAVPTQEVPNTQLLDGEGTPILPNLSLSLSIQSSKELRLGPGSDG